MLINEAMIQVNMKARLVNFRGAYKQQKASNQVILLAEGVSNKEGADKLVGKKASWTNTKGTSISGKVSAAHGRNGAVRAIFEKGLPGQALGSEVQLE